MSGDVARRRLIDCDGKCDGACNRVAEVRAVGIHLSDVPSRSEFLELKEKLLHDVCISGWMDLNNNMTEASL